ncbi:MAG TPA: glycoside hydrolase family 2 TIM barrel-domain containing protein, partial [Puia sp.]
MKTRTLIFCLAIGLSHLQTEGQQTITQYLSGKDKDHTLAWDFFCTTGRRSGKWDKIPVPSNWELQGFGTYNYFTDKENPDEQGLYRHAFAIDAAWAGKRIYIVFEGSMTDTEVKINGKSAGAVHQGGYYRFKYDITSLVRKGKNLLEVKVSKRSANASINQAERKADFWQFGGIFRPVYLEIVPQTHIDRMAIDAKADGSLRIDVFTLGARSRGVIRAEVQTLNGRRVGEELTAEVGEGSVGAGENDATGGPVTLRGTVPGINAWNPESPVLYNLVVSISDGSGRLLHTVTQRFGFRTMELRVHDGIYVNGKRVIFKGVCRHSEWPETGRTLSKDISILDVNLMKDMNMNAVRMSHYPPDQHFLDVCDSLGMFVLDELTGWQAKYDTVIGKKLVKELVVRDVNHPSIVLWDNGNEGGWNTGLDDQFRLYDPQDRRVIHPWEKFNGTDTRHYPDYNYVENSVLYGQDIFFPTEFMHGNYDGGGGAGLEDYWQLILRHPHAGGGFIWVFADAGILRTDKDSVLDTAGDQGPDGVLGPHREKEGSYFTIKELWSPVVIDRKIIPPDFDGRIAVENRYIFTNLDQCRFSWKLVSFPAPGAATTGSLVSASGVLPSFALAPGEKGFLSLPLPATWRDCDALYLTAVDPHGRELFTWTWPVKGPEEIEKAALAATGQAMKTGASYVSGSKEGTHFVVSADGIRYYFDTATGYIEKVV